MDRRIKNLKDNMLDQLAEYADKNLTASNLDAIESLAVAAEKICKLESMELSNRFTSQAMDKIAVDYPYWGGSSYDRGGSYTVRGRYSKSEGKEKMVSELEDMMYNADENEKSAIRKAINALRDM